VSTFRSLCFLAVWGVSLSKPLFAGGPAPTWSVSVTPDGASVQKADSSSGNTYTFTVKNTGSQSDFYDLTCAVTGVVTSCVLNKSTATLSAGASTTVVATYGIGGAGLGVVTVTASGDAVDSGYINVGTTNPSISVAPQNGAYRDVGKCLAACFDAIYAHAAPPYFSLGAARSVAMVYNSATARPRPVILLDVSNNNSPYPTVYAIKVRLSAVPGTPWLTFLNGDTVVYYTAGTTQPSRVGAAFDVVSNGLATGAYDVDVTVRSQYSSGTKAPWTVAVRVIVVREDASAYGQGVTIAGLQRIFLETGKLKDSNSVLVTEGGGSAALFRRTCSNKCPTFEPAAGSPSKLTYDSVALTYRRVYADSSVLLFNNAGYLIRSVGRVPADTTLFSYDGSNRLVTIKDPMNKILAVSYPSGTQMTITDPGGRVTQYLLNSGRLIRATDPDTKSDSLAYNAVGLLTTIWDRARQPTDFTYDSLYRVATALAPQITLYTGAAARPTDTLMAGERVVWQPGITGSSGSPKANVRADTVRARLANAVGAATRYELDRFGAPTKVIDPYGATTTIVRDTLSRATLVTGPNGHIAKAGYYPDTSAQKYLVKFTKDSTTKDSVAYTYDIYGRLATVKGRSVPRVDYLYYDGTNGGPKGTLRRIYVGGTAAYPDSVNGTLRATHKPDALGRDTVVIDGGNHTARFFYHPTWGHLYKSKDPLGNVDSTVFDTLGRGQTTWIPASGAWTDSVGALNQVVVSTDPNGRSVRTTYDPATLLPLRIKIPGNSTYNTTYKFAYNAVGALVTQYDFGDTTKADTLKYDAAGNLRVLKSRKGGADSVVMAYDLAGRLVTRVATSVADTFRYDNTNGLWQVATNANAYDSLAFNAAGRLVSSIERLNGATFTGTFVYDTAGRLSWRTIKGSSYTDSVAATYDASGGFLSTICTAGLCMSYNRPFGDPALVSSERIAGPSVWLKTFHYNNDHAPDSVDFTPSSLRPPFATAYAYDSLGRVTTRSRLFDATVPRRKYGYDVRGALTSVQDSVGGQWVTQASFTYDSAGNRTDNGATLGPGNHLQAFGGYSLTYDANGSTLTKIGNGRNWAYVWDGLGRLSQVWDGAVQVAVFGYDALGRRVVKYPGAGATQRYVHDGGQVLLDLNAGNTVTAEYGWEPGVDQLWLMKTAAWKGVTITDPQLGTVMGLAKDSAGVLLKNYPESIWGDVSVDTGTVVRFRTAGAELDQETGLYYMRARYYDPQLGRFLSEDPLGIAGGMNLYPYGGNDPINTRDPSGLDVSICVYDTQYTDAPGLPRTYQKYVEYCYDPFGGYDFTGQIAQGLGRSQFSAKLSGYASNLQMLRQLRGGGGRRSGGERAASIGACFARNTEWLKSDNAVIAGITGVSGSVATIGAGLLAKAQGYQFSAQGTVALDLFFSAPKRFPNSNLIEEGIGAIVAGKQLATTGARLLKGGLVTLGLQVAFGLSYSITTAALCFANPEYGQ